MRNNTLEELRYPIGHFAMPDDITDLEVKDWLAQLEALPIVLEDLVKNLSETQLDTPYRPDGWTVRQVVHHIADSHHHSYIRFKWALTENKPIIKAYDEKAWASLEDAVSAPIELSIAHIKSIHAKLVYLLGSLRDDDLEKVYIHPDGNVEVSVKENIGRYAWHGNHHCAHIERLMRREGWV